MRILQVNKVASKEKKKGESEALHSWSYSQDTLSTKAHAVIS